MSRPLGLSLLLALLICPALIADETEDDLKKLQGDWVLESLVVDGMEWPGDSKNVNQFIVAGNKMTVVLKSPDGKEERKTMEFTLIAGQKPKAIDLKTSDERSTELAPGIYELSDDSFRICAANPPQSKDRPKEFDSKAGSRQVMFVLKRVKP